MFQEPPRTAPYDIEGDRSSLEILDITINNSLALIQSEKDVAQTQGMLSGSCFSLYSKDPALLEKLVLRRICGDFFFKRCSYLTCHNETRFLRGNWQSS